MRQVLQILVIGGLFILVGLVAYQLSGAGELPPEPPARPHFPSTWLEDFATAKQRAARAHKPILVDFQGSDWCVNCIKFHREIVDTAAFQTFARDQVVLLSVDFPHHKLQSPAQLDANEALAEAYGVEGLPALLLLRPDGSVLARMRYAPGGPEPWLAGLAPFIDSYHQEAGSEVEPEAAPAGVPASTPQP